MSAEEMFEELGYKLVKHETYMFYYKDILNHEDEEDHENDMYITIAIEFSFKEKKVMKTYDDDYGEYITLEELKAINKQVEELGWNK